MYMQVVSRYSINKDQRTHNVTLKKLKDMKIRTIIRIE